MLGSFCDTAPGLSLPICMYEIYGVNMRVIYLASLTSDDANVSRDSVSSFDLHQIPHHQFVGIDLVFLAITDYNGLLFGSKVSKDER